MRLRNVVLVSLLTLAGGAVALEFSARAAALRISRALSSVAGLTFEGAGIALDGSIRLRSPRLEIRQGAWKGSVRARTVELRGSGPLWLVAYMISDGDRLPPALSLFTRGLVLDQGGGHMALADWFGTPDLALFENIGCGSDALGTKDRVRMGVVANEREDQFDYRFDATSGHLDLAAVLESSNIANWQVATEWTGFDPAHWSKPNSLHALRLVRAGLSYRDPGYLARRNRFCAEWLGISSEQFIDRHLAALQTFLAARGVEPSADVLALYQRLVARGGTLNISSLPDSGWVPAELEAYPRQVLLRQLNITARLEDAPPIMLRLAFTDPEVPLYVVKPTDAETDLVSAPADASPSPERAATVTPAPESVEASVPAIPPLLPQPTAEPAAPKPLGPVVEVAIPTVETSQPGAVSGPEQRIIASAPPPPENSTLALVWKPGQVERLPPTVPKERKYAVIGKGTLGSYIGRRVQLVTAGGKRVDGEVQSLGSGNVVVSVQRGGGSADLSVPLANIREVRLMGARSAGP